ncbi:helix-turn-helix domain-containing protein [Xanthomonas sp. NCPPB 1067]|uniref:helix-turn-helix domain-containing protein n=1 Tax=Xanthomonas sp. NCPPB 1067 TaxID=487524 RepID=UPI001E544F22|nr:helix-turn-helix transcriptional regulator [Xanthomonas sp. NCPPB 1067]MCC4588725.1 helix-turn-helix domain-containing protein [Xanthomonas sp. NCPPB 1067]
MHPEYNPGCISQQPMLFASYNACCHASVMELRDRIAEAMQHAGLTQDALAKRVDVSQQAIQKLLSGQSKTSRKLTEIAVACRVRPEWLASEDGPMLGDAVQIAPSQPERIDFDRMALTVSVARNLLEVRGDPPDFIEDPVILEIAYQVVATYSDASRPSNVLDLTKILAKRLRGVTDGEKAIRGSGAASGR